MNVCRAALVFQQVKKAWQGWIMFVGQVAWLVKAADEVALIEGSGFIPSIDLLKESSASF